MMERKISVVLPVYNGEKYIARSIRSVLAQTYPKWELLIVNDGSEDATGKIVKHFAGLDKRIRLIDQENQGVSAARNHGIDAASGELLMFLDADDWYEEDAFGVVAANWEPSMEMLFFDYYDVAAHRVKHKKKVFKPDRVEFSNMAGYSMKHLTFIFCGGYTKETGAHTLIGAPWGKVYKTEFIKRMRIRFPADVFVNEDVVFNICASVFMKKAVYVSEIIYNYSMHGNSASAVMYKKDGEKLIWNMVHCNALVKNLFSAKNNSIYKYAYYKYMLEGVKIILWWLAGETDQDKKAEGRNFCYERVCEVKGHLCRLYSFSEKMLIFLCRANCIFMLETFIKMRIRLKKILNRR